MDQFLSRDDPGIGRASSVAPRLRLAQKAAMTSITLFGAGGRLGRAIAEAAAQRGELAIVAAGGDVYVDFSVPQALGAHLDTAIVAGRPILVGTTGLDAG